MQLNNQGINSFNIDKENVNKIIEEAISGIKKDWPTIYKIRHIHLSVGKRLYKDADFFFSVDNKLGEDNLTIAEIKNIYYSNMGRKVRNELKVICKSASYILKMAYDRIGIKADLVETNTTMLAVSDDENFLINHWFLAIYDDETKKTYFATLTPDLPYIQMNMDTRHFASDIPYKRNYNGNVMQIYKGQEIKHSTLSRKELKEIDLAIGYIKNSYQYNDKGQVDSKWFLQYDNASLYMLRDSLKGNNLFYELEINETLFYQSLTEFKGEDNRIISFIDDNIGSLSDGDWDCWIKILCRFVLDRVQEILGYEINVLPSIESNYWNYESWLLNLCVQIQYDLFLSLNNNVKDDFSDVYVDVEKFKYNKWSKQVKARFGKKHDKFDYNDILVILDKMNALINCVKSKGKNGHFNELFLGMAYHFIEPTHLYENNISKDGYLSNYYIANKFDKVFRKVFGCNEVVTEFNDMGYAEKITIIKELLVIMFPEINKNNSFMLNEYNDNYGAVFNRIQLYPIKSKKSGHYSILFNILGDSKSSDYYFFYSAKKNTFKVSNGLDIYNDYIIVSSRMKNRISVEDLEKIDLLIEDGDEIEKVPNRK